MSGKAVFQRCFSAKTPYTRSCLESLNRGRGCTNAWLSGIRRGEHCIHIISSDEERSDLLKDLVGKSHEGESIVLIANAPKKRAAKRKEASGAPSGLSIVSASLLLDGGAPNAESAVGAIKKLVDAEAKKGRKSVTMVIDSSFVLEGPGLFSRYMQVEGTLGLASFSLPTTFICLYDDSKFSHEQIELAMSMHPLVVQGGAMTRNFWLIPRNVDEHSLAGYAAVGKIN